jgi:predicted nuclease of predicted toxin-antitoxin system
VNKGHHADHVTDCDMQSATDRQIWDFAHRSGAVIVTKDEDFAQRKTLVEGGPSVVWIRLPNSRRADLLAWFEKALPEVLSALERADTLVEII